MTSAKAPNAQQRYGRREIKFMWLHLLEYIELNEAQSAEAGRSTKEALRHEWDTLPEGSSCTCYRQAEVPASAGAGHTRPSSRTPNLALADLKRAYEALPIGSHARTVLYLALVPTHNMAIRHMTGQPCEANFEGEQLIGSTYVQGHMTRHTLDQVWAMDDREFAARHRRRAALESFTKAARVQDGWSEPRDMFGWMADYLNLGEQAFIERGDPNRVAIVAQLAA